MGKKHVVKLRQTEEHRVIHRTANMEISTNIPDFKWPTREEKIAALLSTGLIDEDEADRLRSNGEVNT